MTDDPLAIQVFTEIGIIDQLARNGLERALPPPLTLAQFGVLNHLVRLGGDHAPARLAAAFQVTKQTMTSTLQRLAAAGLVAVAPDPADGRGKRVSITPKGAAIRQAALVALQPVMARHQAVVGEALFAQLLPGLRDLRKALDADR